jgi:hypothetical protein
MLATRTPHRSALARARRNRTLVRIRRRRESGTDQGYVVGVSAELVLLAVISPEILLSGFMAVRVRDISSLKSPSPYADFVESALRLRGQPTPSVPKVSLRSFASLIRSAGRQFPVVTLHRERAHPDVCEIGEVASVTAQHVTLREIDPQARWETKHTQFPVREITRVDFGGLYEDALVLVGGKPPS